MKNKLFFIIGLLLFTQAQSNDIFQAIDGNNYEEVQKLLQQDPRLATKTQEISLGIWKKPLDQAILKYKNKPTKKQEIEQNIKIAELLLKNKANPNKKNVCGNPLLYILAEHDLNIPQARILLKYGAQVDSVENQKLESALHRAISKNALQMTRFLLRGANPNVKDIRGNTPLHQVFATYPDNPKDVFKNEQTFVELLAKRGADINTQNNDKLTPLHLATSDLNIDSPYIEQRYNTIIFLLKRGANSNKYCFPGGTFLDMLPTKVFPIDFVLMKTSSHWYDWLDPTFQAVENSDIRLRILKLLINNGANIEHINNRYLQHIQEYNSEEIMDFLQKNIKNRKALGQSIKALLDVCLEEDPNESFRNILITIIKKFIKQPLVPAYDKLLAFSYLAAIHAIDNIYCFEEKEFKNLLAQIPFNHTFFRHEACQALRHMALHSKKELKDINGQTLDEAMCNFIEYIPMIFERNISLFCHSNLFFYGGKEQLTPLCKQLTCNKVEENDLKDPFIFILNEKINGPSDRENNQFRKEFLNRTTNYSILSGADYKLENDQKKKVDTQAVVKEVVLYEIFSYLENGDFGEKTQLPPEKLMPNAYANSKKRKRAYEDKKNTHEPKKKKRKTKI